MASRRNLKAPIAVFLVSVILVFSMLLTFSVSCQAPATTPPPAPGPSPTTNAVDISGFAFVPATITIPAGTEITWTNQDSASHTVTSESGLFDSGTLSKNGSFSYLFNQTGTFKYYCTIHPYMKGTVIVE